MKLFTIAARVASHHYADVDGQMQTSTPVKKKKLYRVITDEPVGVAVGFRPSDDALESVEAELEEFPLLEDDKSPDAMPFLSEDGKSVRLLSESSHTLPEGGWDLTPLGPDMSVWRSEKEMLNALGGDEEYD